MKYILPTIGVTLHLLIVGFFFGINGLFVINLDALTTFLIYIPFGFIPVWPLIHWYQQHPSPIAFMWSSLLEIGVILMVIFGALLVLLHDLVPLNQLLAEGHLTSLLLYLFSGSLISSYLIVLVSEYNHHKTRTAFKDWLLEV